MDVQELEKVAAAIVADGKGILAADESTGTIKKRFDSSNLGNGVPSEACWRIVSS
jgi:fructose-bisphosphate aldolase class I